MDEKGNFIREPGLINYYLIVNNGELRIPVSQESVSIVAQHLSGPSTEPQVREETQEELEDRYADTYSSEETPNDDVADGVGQI